MRVGMCMLENREGFEKWQLWWTEKDMFCILPHITHERKLEEIIR